jgi:branched-chain amino acid transport system ATP-binding protein
MRMSELLRIEGLQAGYGEAVVLQEVSLTLQRGHTLALLGRNGTGKTTLMDTLIGATTWHAGRIVLNGQEIQHLSSPVRAAAGIGWVPQERNIFKSLTVHENMTAVASRSNHTASPWTPERVYALFPRLAERKNNLGTQLSGGEQQMLALGRALVLNPQLLLLDEPLEGLSPKLADELLQAIYKVTREEGMSAMIVEQHPQAILAISQEAVVLDHGTVVHRSSAQSLLDQPAQLDALLGVARAV